MTYRLVVQNEATVDIQEAYEWYELKRNGLGDELVEEIEYCFDKIASSPHNYSFHGSKKNYRRIKINRFPYIIIYEIEGDKVIVTEVHNTWKRPGSKY